MYLSNLTYNGMQIVTNLPLISKNRSSFYFMGNTNSSRDSLTECVVVNHGSNMSAAPIRTSIRRLHCSVCDETWEVDTEEYLKVLEMPK